MTPFMYALLIFIPLAIFIVSYNPDAIRARIKQYSIKRTKKRAADRVTDYDLGFSLLRKDNQFNPGVLEAIDKWYETRDDYGQYAT